MQSLDATHLSIGRRGVLVKEVRQVLRKFVLGDEFRNDETGWSALAIRSHRIDLPKRPLALYLENATEDVESLR